MKKFLAGLFILVSATALADSGINFYGKFGVDIYSNFKDSASYYESETDYFKADRKGGTDFNFALEVTKNITPSFELGAGLAYTYRKDADFKL